MKQLLFPIAIFCAGCTTPPSPHTITVYGTAVVRAQPEQFDLALKILSTHSDPVQAQAASQQKLARVKELLRNHKVEAENFIISESTVRLEETDKSDKPPHFQALVQVDATLPSSKQREDLALELIGQRLCEITGQSQT